jgi:hypothetical protein
MFIKSSGPLPVRKGITVKFAALAPTATRLSVTASTAAVFDFGRRKRPRHGVLDALGAQYDETS